MADILPFKPGGARGKAKKRRQEKAHRQTLCRRGFHKWAVDQRKQFDVKQGRLVTIYRCEHCGASKTRAE